MNSIDTQRNKLRIALLAVAASFYVLEGVLLNPFIVWTSLPLYVGYTIVSSGWKTGSGRKLSQGYGFLILSIAFSYLYHLAWYLDWDHTKTGSSTSALIFVWFPIYAVVIGYVGYFLGSFLAGRDEAR